MRVARAYRHLIFLFAIALVIASPALAQETNGSPALTPRLTFGGFGALDFRHTNRSNESELSGGEFDGYFTAHLSDNWSILGEVLFQRLRESSDVDRRVTKKTELDLERLYLAYNPSDRFRIEAGQVHTGLIRWNEREHRGRFLQTTIDVPAIAQREEQGGAWPIHFFGIWGSGRLGGPLGITYGGGIGEGRGRRRDEIQTFSDVETSPAAVVSLGIEPDAIPGLSIDVSAYHGEIPAPSGALKEFDHTIAASYTSGGLEVRAEWARMDHRSPSMNHLFVTDGWYALASFRLHGALHKFRPYVLVDRLSLPRDEAYLEEVPEQEAVVAGVRWDLSEHFALKVDTRSQKVLDEKRERLLRAELAFSF